MSNYVINENDMRYGTSALDLSHKEVAENDELLVRGSDGKMYYKRDDGVLVTYETQEYDKLALVNDMKNTYSRGIARGDASIYLTYNTIDITGKTNITSTSANLLSLDRFFKLSESNHGVYIRIRGTEVLNAVASYMEYTHKEKAISDINSVEILVSVVYNGIAHDVTINGKFNKLMFSDLEIPDGTTGEIKLMIKSVSFPALAEMYNNLTEDGKEAVKKLNNGNDIHEATVIDFISYVDSTNDVVLRDENDGIQLMYIIHSDELTREFKTGSDAIVISKDRPVFPCLWGKIVSP